MEAPASRNRGALIRASGAALGIRVTGAGAAFVLQVLIARSTGVSVFGTYLFVLGWIGIAVLICKLGIDTLIVRSVPKYRALGSREAELGFLAWARGRLLAQLGIALGCAGVLLLFLREELGRSLWYAFACALPLTAVIVWNSYLQAVSQALGRPWAYAPEQLLRPVLFIALIVGYHAVWSEGTEAWQLLVLSTVAAAVASIAAALAARPALRRASGDRSQQATWRASLGPLFLIGAANVVLSQTDVIMLGLLRSDAEVGLYGAAARIVVLTSFGLAAVNTYMAPRISYLFTSGDLVGLQYMARTAARIVFGFTMLVVAFLAIKGEWVLGLFGPTYVAAHTALQILMIGQLVSSLAGSVGQLQAMTGHEQQLARIMMFSAFVNVVLNLILIPAMGITGAAASTATAMVLWNAIGVVVVRQRIGIRSTAL